MWLLLPVASDVAGPSSGKTRTYCQHGPGETRSCHFYCQRYRIITYRLARSKAVIETLLPVRTVASSSLYGTVRRLLLSRY